MLFKAAGYKNDTFLNVLLASNATYGAYNRNYIDQFCEIPWNQTTDVHRGSTYANDRVYTTQSITYFCSKISKKIMVIWYFNPVSEIPTSPILSYTNCNLMAALIVRNSHIWYSSYVIV